MQDRKILKAGFTLIEMAIVVVIIGLLIAGALGGEQLIETSRRNRIVTDLKTYQIAFDQFKEKYDGIAGDLSDATNYWGSKTSNGNGTGYLNDGSNFDEAYLFWQHLGLSGYIVTTYSGTANGINVDPKVPGTNVPVSSYKKSAYVMMNANSDAGQSAVVALGATYTGIDFPQNVVPLTTLKQLDTKLDDGAFDTGRLTYQFSGKVGVLYYFLQSGTHVGAPAY
jgi:prepilin-type N-terminal cleavage/methylation domain-containing protein